MPGLILAADMKLEDATSASLVAVTAFGIFEQWGRRNQPPGGMT